MVQSSIRIQVLFSEIKDAEGTIGQNIKSATKILE